MKENEDKGVSLSVFYQKLQNILFTLEKDNYTVNARVEQAKSCLFEIKELQMAFKSFPELDKDAERNLKDNCITMAVQFSALNQLVQEDPFGEEFDIICNDVRKRIQESIKDLFFLVRINSQEMTKLNLNAVAFFKSTKKRLMIFIFFILLMFLLTEISLNKPYKKSLSKNL